MSFRPIVTLPDRLVARCDKFAHRILADFERSPNPYSRDGIERDWNKQALAKMGECAACLYFELDPETALTWDARPDPGFDLIAAGGQRIDIKTVKHEKHFLLWSRSKNQIYHRKEFDVLLHVKENLPNFIIWGWITKTDFYNLKKVAPEPPGHRLQPDTWFVHESRLNPIAQLFTTNRPQPLPPLSPRLSP